MTKRSLFLLLILFASCTLLGFFAARQSFFGLGDELSDLPGLPNPSTINGQANLLLVRVNDLASTTPQLHSMWAVFFTQANPPAIVIKSLYPQLTGNELTAFEYQFALNDEGMLSNNFLNALRSYDLTWNGLILIDDAGLHGLSRYILEEGSGENTQAGLPVIMGGMLEEYALYDRLCLALPVKTSPPNWDNIVPNHVRSDLPLEYAKIFWAFMSVPQIHCEMIPLQ